MAQSYIPAGTDVICTEMMGGQPAQLGLTRTAKVLYGSENKPILNICDKKLSCSLQCRIKQSFFAGLGALLVGLALGALAVALVVATAGAGAIVVGAALGTALLLDVAGGVALGASLAYKYAANECDSTLSGQWELYHRKVYLENHNALLQRSILTCSKGGVVSLVMNHTKAVELAKKISDTNQEAKDVNMWSKFAQGLIGASANAFKASGGGDVAGLIISSGFATYDYLSNANDNYSDKNMQNQQEYAQKAIGGENAKLEADGSLWTEESTRDTGINTVLTVGDAAIPVIGSNREVLKTLAKWGGEEVAEGNFLTHAFWTYFAGKTTKDMGKAISKDLFTKVNAQKFGVGIMASIVSNGIEWGSNKYENNLYTNMIANINIARQNKDIQGINIQAQQL